MPVLALRCRVCEAEYALEGVGVCQVLLRPARSRLRPRAQRARVTRASIEAGPASLWRYADAAPGRAAAARRSPRASRRLFPAPRLARSSGWASSGSSSTPPTPRTRSRTVASRSRPSRPPSSGSRRSPAHRRATSRTRSPPARQPTATRAAVFCPAGPRAREARRDLGLRRDALRGRGSYDDVSRLTVELSFELDWGFVNAQLRSYYAEGSKTVAFEIAEQLGWRAPTAVSRRSARGRSIRSSTRASTSCSPSASSTATCRASSAARPRAAHRSPTPSRGASGSRRSCPTTVALSIAIGNPADGDLAVATARESGGAIYAVPEEEIAGNIAELARGTGVWGETAPAVTFGALKEAVARGELGPDDRVVSARQRRRAQDAGARQPTWSNRSRSAPTPTRSSIATPRALTAARLT